MPTSEDIIAVSSANQWIHLHRSVSELLTHMPNVVRDYRIGDVELFYTDGRRLELNESPAATEVRPSGDPDPDLFEARVQAVIQHRLIAAFVGGATHTFGSSQDSVLDELVQLDGMSLTELHAVMLGGLHPAKGGTGAGLAVAKSLVSFVDGRLRIDQPSDSPLAPPPTSLPPPIPNRGNLLHMALCHPFG